MKRFLLSFMLVWACARFDENSEVLDFINNDLSLRQAATCKITSTYTGMGHFFFFVYYVDDFLSDEYPQKRRNK